MISNSSSSLVAIAIVPLFPEIFSRFGTVSSPFILSKVSIVLLEVPRLVGLPLDFDFVPNFSRFWGILFRALPRDVSRYVTKAFESVPRSRSFW